MMSNSQVCVVSNPYLVALDGLPSIDFIYDDIRTKKKGNGVPIELKKFRKESNLRRLGRLELSAVMNRLAQTKATKKYAQSESLKAAQILKTAQLEKE